MQSVGRSVIQAVAIGQQALPAQLQLPERPRGLALLVSKPSGGDETAGQLKLAADLASRRFATHLPRPH